MWPRRRRCKTDVIAGYPRTGHAAPRCDHRRAHGRVRAAAAAQGTQLMPGVTYDRTVVVHAARRRRAARHHGAAARRALRARARCSPAARSRAGSSPSPRSSATSPRRRPTAGINGDFVRTDGRPSGVWIGGGAARAAAAREPQLDRHRHGRDAARRPREALRHLAGHRPAAHAGRAQPAAGAGPDRALHARPTARAPRPSPAPPRSVLGAFPPTAPNTDLAGAVTAIGVGRRRADPARRRRADGGRRERLRSCRRRRRIGTTIHAPARPAADLGRRDRGARRRPGARPEREGGLPLARGLHERPGRPRAPRAARSASSPTAASSSSPSTADARATASGLTSFELAQALVRLGAVTAAGVDPGDDVTAAFDGRLLNRPSGRARARRQGGAARPVLRRLRARAVAAAPHRRARARPPSRSRTRSCARRR